MKKCIYPLLALVYGLAMYLSAQVALQPGSLIPHPLGDIYRTVGVLLFSLLLFGILRFSVYLLTARPRLPLLSWRGWALSLDGFYQQVKRALHNIYTHAQAPWRRRLAAGTQRLVLTAAAAYALVLVEWVFQATKVSFMYNLDLGQKAAIYLLSGLFFALFAVAVAGLLLLLELPLRPLRLAWLAAGLGSALPAFLLTGLVVLWLDSFTYTVFRFGILTADGLPRLGYGVLACLLFFGLYGWLLRLQGISGQARLKPAAFKWLAVATLGLCLVSAGLAVTQLKIPVGEASQLTGYTPAAQELPDIILIGGDGLSADHMSLYGYTRQTTPNLAALAETSLVAENAYANASKTYGAVISLLTGKLPTTTGVMFPPDILQGADAYQHLPGILKELGYYTAQVGVDTYVDANAWNAQNAFDWVNHRPARPDGLAKTLHRLGYDLPAYFLSTVKDRLVDRFYHALYIDTVENTYPIFTRKPQWREDSRRVAELLDLLENTPGPLFVHVHLVETHGPKYYPAIRNFSAGLEQTDKWMPEFYDDAILAYDAWIGQLLDSLQTSGRFQHTLLIVYSDHAMGFRTTEHVPLLIHFPADQFAGKVQTNVQNLDIAPTILDYLGAPVPTWMEGTSILQLSTQVRQPLFAVRVAAQPRLLTPAASSDSVSAAPFATQHYPYVMLQVFYCQRMYQLDLLEQEWITRSVSRYTAPCRASSLPDLAEIRQLTIDFLVRQGFDPSVVP